jgi:hypothetical protein
MSRVTYDPDIAKVANAVADATAKQPPLSLAQAIYGHLWVNEAKQPFVYRGNPITIRAAKGKAYSK